MDYDLKITELELKIQALDDKLDAFIEKSNVSGVYTDEAPNYVKDYVRERKMAGEKK